MRKVSGFPSFISSGGASAAGVRFDLGFVRIPVPQNAVIPQIADEFLSVGPEASIVHKQPKKALVFTCISREGGDLT